MNTTWTAAKSADATKTSPFRASVNRPREKEKVMVKNAISPRCTLRFRTKLRATMAMMGKPGAKSIVVNETSLRTLRGE